MFTRHRRLWGMVAVCLAAFALRVGPLWDNRFHPDEALYASWGLLIRTGRDVWLSNQNADKPPLMFYLLAVSFQYLWRSEIAARLPNLIASTLSIPLIFQIARPARFSNWAAAILLTFSPFAILFSPTAFLDPLMVMLALAACVAATHHKPGWTGILLGLSAATKLTGIAFLPLVMGLLVLDCRLPIARRFPTYILRFLASLAIIIVLIIIWDRLKGGVPFWVQQNINYKGLYLVPFDQVLPRLRAWLDFFPCFFGWPALIVIAGLLGFYLHSLLFAPRCLSLSYFLLFTFHAIFYFAIHWLLTFHVWDRYLLGLVPIIALLAGQLADSLPTYITHYASPLRVTRYVSRVAYCVFFTLLLLPPALVAAESGYALGGDHGAYDGIDQVAEYMRAQPVGTVLYDHWLGWEFKYYLWDAQVYIAYFPTPNELCNDLRANGGATPRYITLPAYVSAQPVLEAIAHAGFSATPVSNTLNRRGQPTFTVYQITYDEK